MFVVFEDWEQPEDCVAVVIRKPARSEEQLLRNLPRVLAFKGSIVVESDTSCTVVVETNGASLGSLVSAICSTSLSAMICAVNVTISIYQLTRF
jgi:hypothetical protein